MADGPAGVLHGLATLRQSITNVPGGFAVPAMAIDDAPRFAWRGVMIDVARHFMSLPTLERQIDAMELVKLNVLHLHLSDNEALSGRKPALSEAARGLLARHLLPGGHSPARVVCSGSRRADRSGVRRYGPLAGNLKAYPQYASGEVEGRDYFSAILGSALDPADRTFVFLDRLFGEMAGLFPDPYFHVGGDEISGADWKTNPQIQEFMRANDLKTLAELESYFFDRVRQGVVAHGKKVVGWEEVARAPVPDDVVVQTWRSSGAIARVTGQGNRVIATCGYYFDKLWPCESHYGVDPHDPTSSGLHSSSSRKRKRKDCPRRLVAEDEVIDPSLKLSPAQRALVLGW